MIKYKINKVRGTKKDGTPKKTFYFYASINGYRITKINYARKYDAKAVLKRFLEKYTEEERKTLVKRYEEKQTA